MYEEVIKKLNPKPKFNLNWYKNEDLYSEGDVEDEIIKLIAEMNRNIIQMRYIHILAGLPITI